MTRVGVPSESPGKDRLRLPMSSGEVRRPAIAAGLATLDGTRVAVVPRHRLFLRTVATFFDTHFVSVPNRHAKAV